MSGAGKAQFANSQEGEPREIPYSGPAGSLTPLERAVLEPGKCCVCGTTIPVSELRCEEHEAMLREALSLLHDSSVTW